ncbi:hypothetical protein [Lentiprolixibacter aurantiacus]|uniref:Uncharacterized protein n=1 Tax=Lentiprolixibacter aurantiacus TaxID=2993939 RepID=A0AAE3MLG7_9FLAO|nr:hypothetical protein [Lentiprolixibacter aurantiacus]MCX2719079.1 hypothetical protein [Lentiprolixibacter aurantiacus]
MKIIVCYVLLALGTFCNLDEDYEYEECLVDYYIRISENCDCNNDACIVDYSVSEEEYKRLKNQSSACPYVQVEVLDSQEKVEGYFRGYRKKGCF